MNLISWFSLGRAIFWVPYKGGEVWLIVQLTFTTTYVTSLISQGKRLFSIFRSIAHLHFNMYFNFQCPPFHNNVDETSTWFQVRFLDSAKFRSGKLLRRIELYLPYKSKSIWETHMEEACGYRDMDGCVWSWQTGNAYFPSWKCRPAKRWKYTRTYKPTHLNLSARWRENGERQCQCRSISPLREFHAFTIFLLVDSTLLEPITRESGVPVESQTARPKFEIVPFFSFLFFFFFLSSSFLLASFVLFGFWLQSWLLFS